MAIWGLRVLGVILVLFEVFSIVKDVQERRYF
jgi:hypothetical protein